jgi:hypothetical protein
MFTCSCIIFSRVCMSLLLQVLLLRSLLLGLFCQPNFSSDFRFHF